MDAMTKRPRHPIHVVGTGLSPAELPPEASRIVAGAEVLFGGTRLLQAVADHPARKIAIRSPVSEAVEAADRENREGRRVVVLADGDPGFFGIGNRLLRDLGAERVRLHPNVTVLQAAASRIGTTWEDIRTVSLHGRADLWPLRRAVARGLRVGVYTDPAFTPARIARDLQACGVEGWRMHVFEDLGRDTERVRCFDDPAEAGEETYASLAFVLLERFRPPELPLAASLEDERILHQGGLITKREVRAVGLGLLGLHPKDTVWDLGSGSGAVALEASALAFEGRVYAVERDEERLACIRENVRRTGACVVEPVQGEMPACLDGLPAPDRVFLGGGIRAKGVLETVTKRLRPGGRLAIHAVLLATLEQALKTLRRAGWAPAVTQVQVSRSRPLAGDLRLEALNPVCVVSAKKPAEEGKTNP